jgi:uncharacterized BrkB/YihY/UPF0761 family membrane protein
MNLGKYICVLALIVSCVSCSIVGNWWVTANGYSGELAITSVDTYVLLFFSFLIFRIFIFCCEILHYYAIQTKKKKKSTRNKLRVSVLFLVDDSFDIEK